LARLPRHAVARAGRRKDKGHADLATTDTLYALFADFGTLELQHFPAARGTG
jgi:hypothetical protein